MPRLGNGQLGAFSDVGRLNKIQQIADDFGGTRPAIYGTWLARPAEERAAARSRSWVGPIGRCYSHLETFESAQPGIGRLGGATSTSRLVVWSYLESHGSG